MQHHTRYIAERAYYHATAYRPAMCELYSEFYPAVCFLLSRCGTWDWVWYWVLGMVPGIVQNPLCTSLHLAFGTIYPQQLVFL